MTDLVDALVDDPRSQRVLTSLDALRRPHLPVLGKYAPLVPARRDRVVVVSPLYNYGHFLEAAVRSVADQEGVDVRHVVVDDRSTDDSYEVAQEIARRYPTVTVLRNEVNSGPGETFNRGWQAVDSDFVVRLDPDDLLPPGALARAVALAQRAPSVGLVYGHFREFSGEPPAPHLGAPFGVVWPGRDWLRRELEDDRNVIATPEAVVRTSLMREHGGWKPELRHTQDMEMWMRAATVSDVGRVFDADQALKRVHDASLGAVERSVGETDTREHLLALDAWWAGVGRTIPEGADLYALGRRALARRALEYARHAYRRGTQEQSGAEALRRIALDLDPAAPGRLDLEVLRRSAAALGPRARYSPWAVGGAAAYRARETMVRARHRRTGL